MPKLTQSFQSSQFKPHKRARYASDTTSEPDSAQQQSIMELPLGHRSQQSEYDYMDTTMINAATATPDISINQRHLSPEDDEDSGENDDDDDDYDDDNNGLEISDLPSSFPISQLTTQSSSSPTVRFQAIKQAMQEKFLNREISFHLPSSSFADETFLKHPDPDVAGERQTREREGQISAPSPSSSPSRLGGDDNQSEISLSESEFDSQNTISSGSPGRKLRRMPQEGMSLVESWDYSEIELEEDRLRLSHRYARIAAYRAAREGTYEAWSTTCPMLSVGDNHTEKEIEL